MQEAYDETVITGYRCACGVSYETERQTTHIHDWTEGSRMDHYDAYVRQVWVEDSAAWDEPVYKTRTICNGCGSDITGNIEHIAWCGEYGANYHSERVQVGTVHHEATGHYEEKILQEACDVLVVGWNRCSCGADNKTNEVTEKPILYSHNWQPIIRELQHDAVTEQVWIEATGHYETKVIQEAYIENVITGYTCSCGEIR